MDAERAKELIKKMIESHQEGCVGGEPLSDDDVINYLFTLDFTEEELLELGFSEDAIDSANKSIMSASEQFEYMKVKLTIEETVVETFEIEVPYDEDGLGNATEIGIEKYKNGELVLEPGEVQFRQIMAESIDGSFATDWTEF